MRSDRKYELGLRTSLAFHSGEINFSFEIKNLSDAWLQRYSNATGVYLLLPAQKNKNSYRLQTGKVRERGKASLMTLFLNNIFAD